MASRWNAKADAVSTMVLWMGSLIAAIICVAWLAQNLTPDHITVQMVDNELTNMQRDINTACRMSTYWKNYYPQVNEGNLIINDLQVCIDTSQCDVVFFEAEVNEPVINDMEIIVEQAYPCENIEKCSSLYFVSDIQPVFDNTTGSLTISNATTCENKNLPVSRCRLLMCSLNQTINVRLDDVIYLNLTKNENGTFNIERH